MYEFVSDNFEGRSSVSELKDQTLGSVWFRLKNATESEVTDRILDSIAQSDIDFTNAVVTFWYPHAHTHRYFIYGDSGFVERDEHEVLTLNAPLIARHG